MVQRVHPEKLRRLSQQELKELEARVEDIKMGGTRFKRPRRRHRDDDIDVQQICALAVAGWKREDIARLHQLSYTRIKHILEDNGLGLQRAQAKHEYYPENPSRFLARAILNAACDDWKVGKYPEMLRTIKVTHQNRGWPTLHDELEAFKKEPVFIFWCDLAELDPDAVKERGLGNQRKEE